MLPSSSQAKGERDRPGAEAGKGVRVGDGRERRAVGGLKYLCTSAGQSGPGFNLLGSFSIPKSTRGYLGREPLPQGRAFHSQYGGGVQAYALLLPINNSG